MGIEMAVVVGHTSRSRQLPQYIDPALCYSLSFHIPQIPIRSKIVYINAQRVPKGVYSYRPTKVGKSKIQAKGEITMPFEIYGPLAKVLLDPYGPKKWNPPVEIPLTGLSNGHEMRRYADTEDGPIPWAVPFLISVVTTQEAASAMKNTEAAQQIIATGEIAISQFLDDYCGTPPRLIPWPFPGPPPWTSVIASQLVKAAHTLQGGSLQTALIQLSGRVLDRVALNPQPLPPAPTDARSARKRAG